MPSFPEPGRFAEPSEKVLKTGPALYALCRGACAAIDSPARGKHKGYAPMTPPKISVLYVIQNEFFGGGERAFAQLINGLEKSRYDVFAACLTGPFNPASTTFTRQIASSAQIINLDLRRLINPPAIFKLKNIIRENVIKIVHSQGARANFYSRLAARAAGGTVVVSTIASPIEEYNVNVFKTMAYSALDRFGETYVDKFIAVAGHIERKLVQNRGIQHQKVTRIYNGIDVAKYEWRQDSSARTRSDFSIAADCFLAGAFCRLSWEKGLFHFIEAAKQIADGGDEPEAGIKYLIAGEGALEKDLKLRVKNLGLEGKFIFTGFVEDIRPLLGAADLLVLPSFREGFPMSILEAMAMGKPVVASNIDGVNESVADNVNVLLVQTKDSAALAVAITAMFKEQNRAHEMGARGRAMAAENFGIDNMIKAHEEVYEELLRV